MMENSTFDKMLFAATGPGCKSKGGAVNERTIEALARLFSWFFPSLIERKCLFRSLLILKWSAGHGLSPLLNIGLKFSGQVQGHAWLTVDDLPFCDSTRLHEHYPRLLAVKGRIRYWCES